MKKALSGCFSTICRLKAMVDGLHSNSSRFLILIAILIPFYGNGQQQVPMSDFVLFSGAGGAGTSTCSSPGYAVLLGSSSSVNGGTIGSLRLVRTTGSVNITGNVFSKGTIVLANSNTVTGKIAASNSPLVSGTILSVGSGAKLGGDIDVFGNIIVSGGVVSGKVTTNTSYQGPAPAGGKVIGSPALPVFPALPKILQSLIPIQNYLISTQLKR